MRLSLKAKLIGIAIVPLLVTIVVSTFISVSSIVSQGNQRVEIYRERLNRDVEERLQTRTEIAVNAIRKYYNDEDSEVSKKAAMEMVKNLKYGKSGYFWINDFRPMMVMHPYSPHLDGKMLDTFKDPNGVFLFNEMVKVSEADGEGFVPYMWPKPGFENPQPKNSFVKAFKEWGWIIGTGVYIDDIDRLVDEERAKIDDEIQSTISKNIAIGVILILIIGVIAYFIVNNTLIKRIYDLVSSLKTAEEKADFSMRLDSDGTDEIGQSKKAFNSMISSIESSISSLNTVLAAVSQGDLSQKIDKKSKGDLEQLRISTNRSVEMLQEIIKDIKKASMQANLGADELAKSSQSLASGASQQAASLEEISSSLSEVESQTKTNSDHATSAKSLCSQMLESIETGNQHMKTMISSMNEINETSNNVNKIIKVIDEIAFQTNLLALNAAVEAARAGKYGKGFAVVADEVRNLASRSAEAAKNTTDLIQASFKRVEEGVSNSRETAKTLEDINTSASKVNDLVTHIAAASVEQSTGLEEVNKGLSQINSVIQQNASISEQAASASEEMSSLSKQLQLQMNQFVTTEEESEKIEGSGPKQLLLEELNATKGTD